MARPKKRRKIISDEYLDEVEETPSSEQIDQCTGKQEATPQVSNSSLRLFVHKLAIHGFKSYRDNEIVGPFDEKFTWLKW